MTTASRIAANRKNAQRSTGPKTTRGKARSSRNATRHGLTSKQVVLLDEDELEFARFSEDMAGELSPQGRLEELLAEVAIAKAWRLRRAFRMESSTVNYLALDAGVEQERVKANRASVDVFDETDRRRVVDADEYDRATAAAERAEAERDSNHVAIAVTQDARGADMLTKLSRYETALERGMYRALHELERLQAARRGQHVTPPAVLDVEVSSDQT